MRTRGSFGLAVLLLCADPANAEFFPALRIDEIEFAEPKALAHLVATTNEVMRTKHQVPLFLRAYAATTLTERIESVFTLSPADSFATLQKNGAIFAADPELKEVREKMDELTRHGGTAWLKAVRFDGTNTPGWLFNSLVKASDEPALLARVAALADLLTPADGPPPKLNIFRVVAGHTAFTHLVSLNAASEQDLASRLDAIARAGWTLELSSPAEASCVVVRSSIYRELVP